MKFKLIKIKQGFYEKDFPKACREWASKNKIKIFQEKTREWVKEFYAKSK